MIAFELISKMPSMIHSIRIIPNLALVGFLPIFLFCCNGGDSNSEQKAAGSSSIPENIQKLSYDTELSKTEGVSIIRRPDQANGWSISTDGNGGRTANASNSRLEEVIYKLAEFEGLICIDAELPEDAFDIKINAPEGGTFAEMARLAFEKTFGLNYLKSVEPTDVWILERDPAKTLSMKSVESHHSMGGTAQTPGGFGYIYQAASTEKLTDILAEYLEGGIVIDETGLEGYYEFVLSMNHWKPETAIPAVEKLGLKVVRAKRDLPVLRIDYAR